MTTVHSVTEWGSDINELYLLTTIITGFIFFAVSIPFCYAIWKFRAKEGDDSIPKQVKGNHLLEILWTVIPVVLLIVIFVPTYQLIFKQKEAAPADALVIEAIGHQWWWEFRYPEYGIVTANEMFVPENRAVSVKLTSADVIHSFWIPRWGGKVDNLPGEVNLINYVTPTVEDPVGGDYYQGHCAELCGLSHARMRFSAVVLTADRFETWTKAVLTPPDVSSDLQAKGQELFMSKTCFTCHAIAGTNAKGQIGPNLSNFGNRKMLAAGTLINNKENLHAWFYDTVYSEPPYQKIKPNNLMVFGEGFELSEDEMDALAAYLHNSTAKTY